MSSKSRNGLSKREYAAKQAGGSLNYKTGKISTPKKSSSSKSSSSSRYNENQYIAYKMMDQMKGTNFADTYKNTTQKYDYGVNSGQIKDTVKKPSKSSVSTKNNSPLTGFSNEANDWMSSGSNDVNDYARSSQRSSAAKVAGASTTGDIVRKGLGINTANASGGTISAPRKKGIIERGLEIAKDPFGLEPRLRAFFNDAPWGSKIYQAESGAVDAITQALTGTTPELGFSEKYLRDETPIIQDSPIEDNSPRQTPKQDPSPVVHENNDNDNRRTSSRPVSNPIFQPSQSSMISSILGNSKRNSNRLNLNPQSFPDISAGQTTDKTQRRFLGNGLLSKGTYANGSGDYGMEGTFGTNQMSEEDNLLNTLLGIPTAKAAEMQTNLFNQPNTDNLGRPYTGYSAQNGGMSTRYGVDTPPTFTPKNTLNEDYESDATGGYKPQATGGSGSGGVAQQYAQQGENPQEKYYKEAIKNQKQIRNETLKSLKKQLEATLEALNSEYDEAQESGTNALNKQKVEDLNALNARFSFGLNQDPNSEQSIQYAQRTSNDYAGQLADFLQKLSTSRMKDVNSARSTYDQNKSSAIQNYYSQKSSAQEKLAQLMASLEEARINNAKKLSSAGTTAESKKQAAIMKLLNQAANMPSGGREYAQQIANIQGLGDISGYTPNGWENAYNPNFGQSKPSNVVSIGNGYVLDKDTGDVYQAYEE